MEIKKDFMPIYQNEKAFEAQIQQDLKTLVGRIEKLDGVDEAAVLPARDIFVDARVRWKCIYPLCFGYNTSPVCPPHTPHRLTNVKGLFIASVMRLCFN